MPSTIDDPYQSHIPDKYRRDPGDPESFHFFERWLQIVVADNDNCQIN